MNRRRDEVAEDGGRRWWRLIWLGRLFFFFLEAKEEDSEGVIVLVLYCIAVWLSWPLVFGVSVLCKCASMCVSFFHFLLYIFVLVQRKFIKDVVFVFGFAGLVIKNNNG